MNCESKGFHLRDVLLLIALNKKTGELVLESGNNIGTIIFHNGKILQAFSPYSRAIGDLLVEDGSITEAELIEILQQQKNTVQFPIGSLFLKTGKVSFEVIEMMVHEQIRQSVKDFMTWGDIRASFVEKDIRPFDRIHIPVYEFITGEMVASAVHFFSEATQSEKASSTATSPAVATVPPSSS